MPIVVPDWWGVYRKRDTSRRESLRLGILIFPVWES